MQRWFEALAPGEMCNLTIMWQATLGFEGLMAHSLKCNGASCRCVKSSLGFYAIMGA